MSELAQIDQRMRAVENEQAAHRTTLGHINETLTDLRQLLQTSVQLQEKQVAHSEAINRAFTALQELDQRLDETEKAMTGVAEGLVEADRITEARIDKYVSFMRGALWATNGAWVIGIAAVALWLRVG